MAPRFRTGCGRLLRHLVGVWVLLLAFSSASGQDVAPVKLTIPQYMELNLAHSIIDLGTVPPSAIANNQRYVLAQQTFAYVWTNVNATLIVPADVSLSRVGGGGQIYSPTVDLTIQSPLGTPLFDSPNNQWRLSVPPGSYTGNTITIHARIDRVWSVSDLPGNYEGVLVVTLVPAP